MQLNQKERDISDEVQSASDMEHSKQVKLTGIVLKSQLLEYSESIIVA